MVLSVGSGEDLTGTGLTTVSGQTLHPVRVLTHVNLGQVVFWLHHTLALGNWDKSVNLTAPQIPQENGIIKMLTCGMVTRG